MDTKYAIPCGTPVGIYLKSDGIMVIGTGDITKKDGMIVEPAFGVLQSGDYIEAFNGTPLKDKEALVTELNKNGTSEAVLAVRRGDQEIEAVSYTHLKEMNISLLEPIGVPEEMINSLAEGLRKEGHVFTYYDTKTTDVEELKRRSAGQEIVMIANNPYPDEVVQSSDSLKAIAVAFTGIDHVGLAACREKNIQVLNCRCV